MHLHFGTGLVEGIVVSSCLFGWIHFSLISPYLSLITEIMLQFAVLLESYLCLYSMASMWLKSTVASTHYPFHEMSYS